MSELDACKEFAAEGKGAFATGFQPADRIEELRQWADELRDATKEGRFSFEESDANGPDGLPSLLAKATALAERLKALNDESNAKQRMADEDPEGLRYQLQYFRACSWTAEVLEYFGQAHRVREIVEEDGRRLSGTVQRAPCGTLAERTLARQKVWIVLHYVYCCLYREHEYHKALRVTDACSQFVENQLQSAEFPCFLTRARIAAHRGAIHRQLGMLDDAQRAYEEALQLMHQRLVHEKKRVLQSAGISGSRAQHIAREETRAGYEAAKILALGVGWIQFLKGLLQEARVNITTALVMLSPIRDVVRTAYAQLLIGSIERASAGLDAQKLDQAIKIMEGPYRTFGDYNHLRYRSYADYELALAYLYRGKAEPDGDTPGGSETYYGLAENHIRHVLEFSISKDVRDIRWECISLIVLSRIARYRNQIQEAKTIAEHALGLTLQAEQDVQIVLDAHIVLGEALMATEAPVAADFAEAQRHFERALAAAETNPKACAICHVHLTNAFLRQGNLRRALEHFDHWVSLRDKVQHGIVHELARETERDVDEAKHARYIVAGDGTLNYAQHDRKLRQFLMRQAMLHHKNVDEIAGSLGIKRATYYNWLNEMGGRPTKKSAKAGGSA